MSLTIRVITACMIAIGIAGPAWADTVCVDPGAPPPCVSTIAAGIAAADPGETVEIAVGTYTENVIVNKRLRLVGESEDRVVILPPFNYYPGIKVTSNAAGTLLKKFTVRGSGGDGIRIEAGADDVTVEDVTVAGIEFQNCIETRAERTTIDDSKLESCGRANFACLLPFNCPSACVVGLGSDLSVEDTKIFGCAADGVAVQARGATIDESRIDRAASNCVRILGDGATVDETEIRTCGMGGFMGGCGIAIGGDHARLARNEVVTTLEDGICGAGDEALITNNRVKATLWTGIFWRGGDTTISENEITDTGWEGMELVDGPFVVRSNEVEDSGSPQFKMRGFHSARVREDCYAIASDGSRVMRNEAEECAGDGFDIRGDDNLYSQNAAEDNVENGFQLTFGSGNTLVSNTGVENGRFDLCDETGEVDPNANNFGTVSMANCAD